MGGPGPSPPPPLRGCAPGCAEWLEVAAGLVRRGLRVRRVSLFSVVLADCDRRVPLLAEYLFPLKLLSTSCSAQY